MATTVAQSNYWMLKLTSDTTPVYNFKFVVEVYIDGTKQVTLKQPKNTNGSAHLSYEKIVKDYIEITHEHSNTVTGAVSYDSIHLMPQNDTVQSGVVKDFALSENTNTIKDITFKFYEEYSTTATGVVSRTGTTTATDLTLTKLNYANDWEDLMTFEDNLFCFNSSRSGINEFLSELPTTNTQGNPTSDLVPHLTSYNDYKTLSWINSDNSPFDTEAGYIQYRFFEEAPVQKLVGTRGIYTNHVAQVTVQNNSTYGGYDPSSANSDDEYLIYAGVGGANVKKIVYPAFGGYQLQSSSNVKYYTVEYVDSSTSAELFTSKSGSNIKPGQNITIFSSGGTIDYTTVGAANNNVGTTFWATGTPTGTGTFKINHLNKLSKTYLFELADTDDSNCSKYDEFSLAWKNKYGTWDYYMFNGKSSESIAYTRQEFVEKVPGTWNAASFALKSYERGKQQTVEGTKSTTINTRFITEDYNDYFNDMLMSNEVILLSPVDKGDDNVKQVPIPINITDSSISYKTSNNDKLVQYSFTFEYAHKIKTRV